MFKPSPLRKRQYAGTLIGLTIGVLFYILLPLKQNEPFLSLGPMNTGHENLSCNTCHTPSKGTLLQQIQSNIAYTFGQRRSEADFGTENVDNKKCLACHDRPNDRHPTHRFKEPRFKEAMANINAQECETCHKEHNGVRLVLNEANFCFNCHTDLEVKNDPLDVPHTVLVQEEQWSTCLQCHDFHGNHLYNVPENMKDTIPLSQIIDYLQGGKDPFSDKKKYVPLSEEEWLKVYSDKKK